MPLRARLPLVLGSETVGSARGWDLSRRAPILITAALGVVAMLPSVIWALSKPSLLTDDFAHLRRFQEMGAIDAAWHWSFVHPARPLLGPYHVLVYGAIGDRPVVHALVMGLLNVSVVVALWLVGRKLLNSEVALAAALIYAVVPSRTSTRLWFPTGNYLLATCLLIVACWLLFDRDKRTASAVLFASAVLLFEGVVGLVGAALVLWVLGELRTRWRHAALMLVPTALAAASMYLMSPKRDLDDAPNVAGSVSTLMHGTFGPGAWGNELVGYALAAVFATAAFAAIVALLPSFSHWQDRTATVRVGLLTTAAGAAPFIVAGVPFPLRGIFDRANAVPLVGISVVLAGLVELAGHTRVRVALGGLTAVSALLLVHNVDAVERYEDAAQTGRVVLDRVMRDVPTDQTSLVLVVPPVSGGDVVLSAFVYPSDLDAAVQLRSDESRGETLMPWSEEQCLALASGPQALGYNWRTGRLTDHASNVCAGM